jgi:hypothetical protein
MSRLLHAAARGARIQYRSPVDHKWKANFFLPNFLNDSLYRIHPDDEHLQYGPISTALREMAEDYSWNPRDAEERALALVVARQFQACLDDETDFELFYLILAEFLADEGM